MGSQYVIVSLDADKIYLDRGKRYKLHLPSSNILFKTFWSIVLYMGRHAPSCGIPRISGPLRPWFDKTWREIDLVK